MWFLTLLGEKTLYFGVKIFDNGVKKIVIAVGLSPLFALKI